MMLFSLSVSLVLVISNTHQMQMCTSHFMRKLLRRVRIIFEENEKKNEFSQFLFVLTLKNIFQFNFSDETNQEIFAKL